MDPPRSSDLRPHALSCMSSGALTPFGSEIAVYLVGLSHPVGWCWSSKTLTKHKPRGRSHIRLPLVVFPQYLALDPFHHGQPGCFHYFGSVDLGTWVDPWTLLRYIALGRLPSQWSVAATRFFGCRGTCTAVCTELGRFVRLWLTRTCTGCPSACSGAMVQ